MTWLEERQAWFAQQEREAERSRAEKARKDMLKRCNPDAIAKAAAEARDAIRRR